MADNNPISDALKMVPYGFYAVGSKGQDEVNLMVATWLSQVSFSPQLVALGLQVSCHTHKLVATSKVFTINILERDDHEVIKRLTKGRDAHPEKLQGVKYTAGQKTGAPVLDAAAAYLEVEVTQVVKTGGDHDVVIGRVVAAEVRRKLDPAQTLSLPQIGWSYAG